MNNTIGQYAIGELLDGRYFYIPSYQRGYRWTEKQVGDLLRDLLCFANDLTNENLDKTQDQFYCLQPVIAHPITDKDKLQTIFGENFNEDMTEHGVWEIIDGQQRLTTIYLLYKYLLEILNYDDDYLKKYLRKEVYHIFYATRDDSARFLKEISLDKIKEDNGEVAGSNVDFFHMVNAYKYIDEWINKEGGEINSRYQMNDDPRSICNELFDLLNGKRNTKGGSVQVLWYEIAADEGKNNIKEFQKINTGKIRLTDAELIKGLFLLDRNFSHDEKAIRQSELALEWEYIENVLHADNFWYFLQKKGTDMPNRISLLFMLIYKRYKLKDIPKEQVEEESAKIDEQLADVRQSTIFRYYYSRFEGKSGKELQQEVSSAWDEVMELFRTLDDWFSTPYLYNIIGLLSQCGEDLSRLIIYFDNMPPTSCRKDFEQYLRERIACQLSGIHVDTDSHEITNSYKEHSNIYKLLLTLNIHLLNEQNAKMQSESDLYKFPFDVLNAQNWDIEHIDSFHTNALKSDSDKTEWIDTALMDRQDALTEDERIQIERLKSERNFDEAISLLKQNAHEDDADEETKNSVGNLTLLDASTNRSYGNSLFCTKRRVIIERIKEGVFVPIATQYVFAKFFDKTGTNRSIWSADDMKEYQHYIYDNIKDYLKSEED